MGRTLQIKIAVVCISTQEFNKTGLLPKRHLAIKCRLSIGNLNDKTCTAVDNTLLGVDF